MNVFLLLGLLSRVGLLPSFTAAKEIAIVGGGITGYLTALELFEEPDLNIDLIDRHPLVLAKQHVGSNAGNTNHGSGEGEDCMESTNSENCFNSASTSSKIAAEIMWYGARYSGTTAITYTWD